MTTDDGQIMSDPADYIATGGPITFEVDPTPLGDGLSWRWKEAVDAARRGCPDCGRVPCWRHATPDLLLVGFDYEFGPPAFEHDCYSGAARDRCTGTGGITIQGRRGMVASACEPCAAAHLEETGR